MNPLVELNLALILFLPWYLVVSWAFWRMSVRNSTAGRRLLAAIVLIGAIVVAAFAGVWAYGHADPATGAIWKQVLATVVGYGAYVGVLLIGFALLRLVQQRHRP